MEARLDSVQFWVVSWGCDVYAKPQCEVHSQHSVGTWVDELPPSSSCGGRDRSWLLVLSICSLSKGQDWVL